MAIVLLVKALLLLTMAVCRVYSVPLLEDEPSTEDTSLPLPQPANESEFHNHEFIADLNRCLKLRDEKRDLAALGCVPEVFSSAEDIPLSSISNTVLSYIAINTSVGSNDMSFTLSLVENIGLVKINSIHLRLYKRGIERPIHTNSHYTAAPQSKTTGLVQLSLVFSSTKSAVIWTYLHTMTYEYLMKEGWIDLHLDKDIVKVEDGSTDDTFNVTISVVEDLSLQDIGIDLELKKEPVLIVFANEQMQVVIEMLLNQSLHYPQALPPHRNRRQFDAMGGSGSFLTDPEKCRLIKYDIHYVHISPAVIAPGKFAFNYCAGQCIWPLAQEETMPYFHSILLAIFQLEELSDPRSETAATTPPPCCIPVEFSPLSVPFIETSWSQKLVTLDITATKCACR